MPHNDTGSEGWSKRLSNVRAAFNSKVRTRSRQSVIPTEQNPSTLIVSPSDAVLSLSTASAPSIPVSFSRERAPIIHARTEVQPIVQAISSDPSNDSREPLSEDRESHSPTSMNFLYPPSTYRSETLHIQHAQPSPSVDLSGDRKRTEVRLSEAVKHLEGSLGLKLQSPRWEGFEIPNFEWVSEEDPIQILREEIETRLEVQNSAIKNHNCWSNFKHVMEQIFTSISPFAKTILKIGKDGSAIPMANPYGLLCSGLLLLITIAEVELARREAVKKKLDYISQQLAQLEIIKRLPEADIQIDPLVNRAMDVLSAVLNYLAVHICHESDHLGIIGNIMTTFVKGDGRFEAVDADLRSAVEAYNASLSNFGVSVSFRTFEVGSRSLEIVEGLRHDISMIRHGQVQSSVPMTVNDKFMVPYQRNPHFKGREDLLVKLHIMLCENLPDRWNHRVALYGLGGVGKTQLAIEYVHRQRVNYERVFWISAVSEVTLLSGFQEIAKRTRCVSTTANFNPTDVAKTVLEWLSDQEKWLLVIDNLDDVTMIDAYLPEGGLHKHTLITTRSQHCDHIPAEGLAVGVLNIDEAIDLLLSRSKLGGVRNIKEDKTEASKIVKKLGYLPLAIEQAAAYIRETSKDIFKFLPSYQKDRKAHHARSSKGNRIYYKRSIATTWHLSFHKIEEENVDASKLLRLLAFLNPDGVLVDFLLAGKDGLDAELQEILIDSDRFYEALCDLLAYRSARPRRRRTSYHRSSITAIRDPG